MRHFERSGQHEGQRTVTVSQALTITFQRGSDFGSKLRAFGRIFRESVENEALEFFVIRCAHGPRWLQKLVDDPVED